MQVDRPLGAQPLPPPHRRNERRRNALIAGAIAVPVAVVLAFALAPGNKPSTPAPNAPLSPITLKAPTPDDATLGVCAKLLSALPLQLGSLNLRQVHPSPPNAQAVAWGDPAVVLLCGAARPDTLVPNSSDPVTAIDTVNWLQSSDKGSDVFVAIDRAVYVQVNIPSAMTFQPLPIISDAIAKELPAVCEVPETGQPAPAVDKLCTHRP